jgi:hypothetical protein
MEEIALEPPEAKNDVYCRTSEVVVISMRERGRSLSQ